MIERIDRLVAEERFKEALEALDALASETLDDAVLFRYELRRGEALLRDMQVAPDEAILVLEGASEREVHEAELSRWYANRIFAWSLRRFAPLLEPVIEEALERHRDGRVLVAAGRASLSLDKRDLARSYLAEALQLAPDEARVRDAYADFLFMHGDFQGAVEHLDAIGPDDPARPRLDQSVYCAESTAPV